jgi:very-short-patch-repair endonuclease
METLYLKSIDTDIMPLFKYSQKINVTRHLKKNYKENIHYIIKPIFIDITIKKRHGGSNRVEYMLTDLTFDMLKTTFNIRNNYITNSVNIKLINQYAMCIENQTIGFIENTYNNIVNMRRQYNIGKYRVDLYFTDYNIIIECDENNHIDRDIEYEKEREIYLLSLKNTIIRFNPNDPLFDLSNVLNRINTILITITHNNATL